jgi:hypothetical protein
VNCYPFIEAEFAAGPRRAARGGRRHSRKRAARLMRAPRACRGRAAKRWKKTTIPDPAAAARADRIRRDFTGRRARSARRRQDR